MFSTETGDASCGETGIPIVTDWQTKNDNGNAAHNIIGITKVHTTYELRRIYGIQKQCLVPNPDIPDHATSDDQQKAL